MQEWESFEIEVKSRLEFELNKGDLGISPQLAQVFHRKPYFSRDRGKDIVFDVSLELYRQGSITPYLLWVWECKDYSHLVPVDDIEEFHAKLEQIGLHKTKGTVACRNGFQQSAIKVAEAKGIGLVRFLPQGSVIRLLESIRPMSKVITEKGLTTADTRQLETLFYGQTSSGQAVKFFEDLIALELDELS